ncbi:MAG: hypothetical protein DRH26_01050 [Deltaproteobacteria bacterium]|nr:MAG: hypothetical protein DRH26_01050 [Deltaproteobacteria bacterium]
MADNPIADNPKWFDSPESQAAIIDQNFEEAFGSNEDFLNADPATQDEYRQAHKQTIEKVAENSVHNPSRGRADANQNEANKLGLWGNVLNTIGRSHEGALSRADVIDDALNTDGVIDDNFAFQASKIFQKQSEAPQTADKKRLSNAINKLQKATDRDGFLNDAAAWGEFLFKDLPQNLGGVAEVAAESSSSLTVMGMGAWGGAKVGGALGTAIPGAGTAGGAAVGAAAGMFTAEVMDAGTHKFLEQIRTELESKDLALTPANIQKLMDNKDWVENAQTQSLKYGGVLGAIDVALGGLFSRLATLPTRAARKTALQSLNAADLKTIATIAKKKNLSFADVKEDLVNGTAGKILKNRSFKSKLGGKALSYGGEVASEPISEAAATASIGEENTVENLVYETLGGIGAGPYGAAINVAAMGSKLAKNKTGEFTKKIMASTPESRAESKKVRAKKQSESKAEYNFKKEVKKADPNDADYMGPISDPKDEKYDPIKAAAVLSKNSDTDSHDKIKAIEQEFLQGYIKNVETSAALEAKIANDPESVTDEEKLQYRDLVEETKKQGETFKKLQEYTERSKNILSAAANDAEIAPIDVETSSEEEITNHITDSFGSSNDKNITNAQVDELLGKGTLSPEQTELLQALKAANLSREAVSKAAMNKTMDEVGEDIYHGQSGSKFKGIDGYKQGIKNYLKVGDVDNAKNQLEGLKKFRDAHQQKSANVLAFFKHIKENPGKPFPKNLQTIYDKMQADNSNFKIHENSRKYVNAIHQEAKALGDEVLLAESLFKARSIKIDTSVSPKAKPATEAKPAKPVLEEKEIIAANRKKIDEAVGKYKNLSIKMKDINATIIGRMNGLPSEKQVSALHYINKARKRVVKDLRNMGLSKGKITELIKGENYVKENATTQGTEAGAEERDGTESQNREVPEKITDRRTSDTTVENNQRKGDRRKVNEMTIDELRNTVLSNEITGIPNRRAYDEANSKVVKPVQISIDADSLKWVNDNMGHDIGDEMLQEIADTLNSEIDEAFHFHGDEFAAQGEDLLKLLEQLKKVDEILANKTLEVTFSDGKTITMKGLNITYGISEEGDFKAADKRTAENKIKKEAEGKRAARGEQPKNITITPGARPESKVDKISEVKSVKPEVKTLVNLSEIPGSIMVQVKGKSKGKSVTGEMSGKKALSRTNEMVQLLENILGCVRS